MTSWLRERDRTRVSALRGITPVIVAPTLCIGCYAALPLVRCSPVIEGLDCLAEMLGREVLVRQSHPSLGMALPARQASRQGPRRERLPRGDRRRGCAVHNVAVDVFVAERND